MDRRAQVQIAPHGPHSYRGNGHVLEKGRVYLLSEAEAQPFVGRSDFIVEYLEAPRAAPAADAKADTPPPAKAAPKAPAAKPKAEKAAPAKAEKEAAAAKPAKEVKPAVAAEKPVEG